MILLIKNYDNNVTMIMIMMMMMIIMIMMMMMMTLIIIMVTVRVMVVAKVMMLIRVGGKGTVHQVEIANILRVRSGRLSNWKLVCVRGSVFLP